MRLFSLYTALMVVLASIAAPLDRRAGLNPSINTATVNLSPTGGGTYPRLANVQGAIIAVITAFSADTHIVTVTRSTDGGKTFSAWGIVTSGNGDIDNPDLIQLPNGNIICTFRNHDKDSSGAYSYYRITATVSTDGGKSWNYISQVDERGPSGINGLWEPFNRISNSGALQVYYASENGSDDQDILMRSSTNGGATWSGVTTVAGGSTTGRDGMPGCATFAGNPTKVICVFETTEGTGTFTVKSVVSNNDGASWGERSQVYIPTGSNNNAGSPQVTITSDGTLIASFMTDEDTSLHQWVNGANFKIVTSSSSDPPSWGRKTTVSGVQSSWPGLLALGDGTVLGCSDNGGVKCHSVSFS